MQTQRREKPRHHPTGHEKANPMAGGSFCKYGHYTPKGTGLEKYQHDAGKEDEER